MTIEIYLTISGAIFGLVSILHIFRAINNFPLILGVWEAPIKFFMDYRDNNRKHEHLRIQSLIKFLIGGGGGNRTRVREYSAFSTTCLVYL